MKTTIAIPVQIDGRAENRHMAAVVRGPWAAHRDVNIHEGITTWVIAHATTGGMLCVFPPHARASVAHALRLLQTAPAYPLGEADIRRRMAQYRAGQLPERLPLVEAWFEQVMALLLPLLDAAWGPDTDDDSEDFEIEISLNRGPQGPVAAA